MSQEIIKVLDYLGDKIGLGIDWTSANVLPQIMEFMQKYRTYAICERVLTILICSGSIVALVAVARHMCKMQKSAVETKSENWVYDGYIGMLNVGGIFAVIGISVGGIFSAILIISKFLSTLRWIIIPEYQFLNLLQGLMQSAQ